jgi:hypothetical protein
MYNTLTKVGILRDMSAAARVSTGGSLLMYNTLTKVGILRDMSAAARGVLLMYSNLTQVDILGDVSATGCRRSASPEGLL